MPASRPSSDPSSNEPISNTSERIQAVMTFWFGAPGGEVEGRYRKEWFIKDDAFDEQIKQQFLTDIERAARGEYDDWIHQAASQAASQTNGAIALLILLDQFPRNIYRGTPQSFATDSKAIQVAQHLVDSGIDKTLPPTHRFFIYVPFEHQEAIAQQDKAVALMSELIAETPDIDPGLKSGLDYAIRHRDVIAQFGRFPHRNEILGRESSAEERAFLQQPGSRF